jgi:hypothetical protein
MNTVDEIEEQIVRRSDGFFEDEDIRENLHVTISIAGAFYNFLVEHGERPPAEDIDDIMGTIRSGIDHFFSLAHFCKIIDMEREARSMERCLHWDFRALRETFVRGYERFAERPDVSAADALPSLFALTHLELVFLAQHFPSAIFEE